MNKEDVVIATMTWSRDPSEGELLREALSCLANEAIPMTVTDGGSDREFLDYLNGLPQSTTLKSDKPGVLAQIKLSLGAAGELRKRYILYTESDKRLFFDKRLREFVAHAPGDERVGVVLASRSADSFLTYPKSQRYAESVINDLCAESFGIKADYSYGPIIIARDLIVCLELIEEDVGWGWRHFIFGMAHRLGYRIVPWVADLPCPQEQREDGEMERLHRMRQLGENVRGLALSLALPINQLPTRGSDVPNMTT